MKFYKKLTTSDVIQNGDVSFSSGYVFCGRAGNPPIYPDEFDDIRREIPLPTLEPGYRYLELGEILKEGDEYAQFKPYKACWGEWIDTNDSGTEYDKETKENIGLIYRRKIEDTQKPDPGEGYRLLEVGEIIKHSDDAWFKWGWNFTGCEGRRVGGTRTVKYYRRKIEDKKLPNLPDPGPGYRLLKKGETIKDGDEAIAWCGADKWGAWIKTGAIGVVYSQAIWDSCKTVYRRKIEEKKPGIPKVAEGYRYLNTGEIIQKGDEVMFKIDGWTGRWIPSRNIGLPCFDSCAGYLYRRKIEEKKPEIPNPGLDYRLLKDGETVKDGDEIMSPSGNWGPCIFSVGRPAVKGYPCRRKWENNLSANYKAPSPGEGYRILKGDEILQDSDEGWSNYEGPYNWYKTHFPGQKVGDQRYTYRRKLSEDVKFLNQDIDRLKAKISELVQENTKLQREKKELFVAYNNHINHVDPNRRTGRTTRMLEQVAEALANGEIVEVVCVDRNQIARMQDNLEVIMNENGCDLCDHMNRLNFTLINNRNWKDAAYLGMSSPRFPHNTKVFVDHYAAECYLNQIKNKVDKYIHKYDK